MQGGKISPDVRVSDARKVFGRFDAHDRPACVLPSGARGTQSSVAVKHERHDEPVRPGLPRPIRVNWLEPLCEGVTTCVLHPSVSGSKAWAPTNGSCIWKEPNVVLGAKMSSCCRSVNPTFRLPPRF